MFVVCPKLICERILGIVVAISVTYISPLGAEEFSPTDQQRRWWSFQPLADVQLPKVDDHGWVLTDIDRFVLVKLKSRGMSPAPSADKRTLLRRIKFALTGLPPTPHEIESFLQDDSQRALDRVVNQLLASPYYGQHWGRYWLDVVRYTDYLQPREDGAPEEGGFEFYEAFRYRDWVVAALNRDMPFDEFVIHQIAGDRLANNTDGEIYADGLIATTFLSIGVWDNGDADKEKVVSDIVDDQIDAVGQAFLGMTLACARCHDHKYDPISTEDYYGLAGIFYSTRILESLGEVGAHTEAMRVPLVPADYVSRRDLQLARIDQIKEKLKDDPSNQPADSDAAVDSNSDDANGDSLGDGPRAKLEQELRQLQKDLLPTTPTALAAVDGGTPGGLFSEIGDVPIHIGGRYDALGAKVSRRLPSFFGGHEQFSISDGSGRMELVRWVTSAENPLTARVIVNRVWQQLFGQGLVRTPNNFGLLGDKPSHPLLLDWLARRFIDDGWSLKELVRMIMNSRVYQQASLSEKFEAGCAETSNTPHSTNPENRWLGRFQPRRLRAEEFRDSMLSVAARLDPKLGGRATRDMHRPRRSLYIQTVRGDRRNFSTLFDAADPNQCVGRRYVSIVAPQALFLLNDRFVQDQAQHLANRLNAEVVDDVRERVRRAYLVLFGREPDEQEVSIGLDLIARATERDKNTAWTEYAHVLLCTNEFCNLD